MTVIRNANRSSGSFLSGFVLLVACALLLAGDGNAQTPNSSAGPFVIYLVDTLRADRTSPYGASRLVTPALSELAREGIVFENAYSISSWTRPSVATLLTSMLPAATGAWSRFGTLDPKVPYFPQSLSMAGWQTAYFCSNGNVFDPRLGFQRGFSTFRTIHHDPHSTARQVVDPTLSWLEKQKSPKFFLFVHVVDPHAPYVLEPPMKTFLKDEKREGSRIPLDYDRCVRQADDQFARLVSALRAKGFWDQATVIYTSDHGEAFGEHGVTGHGQDLHEEQVRIPLVLKLPGAQEKGGRRSDLVTLADVVPTLSSIAGLKSSPSWIGKDLRRADPARVIYLTEDWDSTRFYALRKGNSKAIVQLYPRFERALYSLGQDPLEQTGQKSGCGEEPHQLFSLLEDLRHEDVMTFPGIRMDKKGREALSVDIRVNVKEVPKPFIVASQYCAFSPSTTLVGLEFKKELAPGERFSLWVSTSEEGVFPPFRASIFSKKTGQTVSTSAPNAPFSIRRITIPFLSGPTVDEAVRNLRGLGYLGP